MTAGLKISPTLSLPLDAVTETFAILAKRRAGKSNAAVVMAEEMFDHNLQWVAIDPKGDWWGVRAAGDGKAPGLAVLVFGGMHGDVPLEPTSGNLVADLVIEQHLTAVLDVSEMTKADQRRFLIDFTTRLYKRNTEPLHVFCEEADEYIPQRVMGPDATLVGAFETLIKRGGFRGIGVTLITQRSASLNKDVLTQIETLIPMRTPSPQDRKAILAWVDTHAYGKEAVDELPSLADGEAWVFSPQWLDTLTKIQFRRRRTFDSGSTPKVGSKPRPPTVLAEVDIASIKEAMTETIEKAKADDPKLLRKRIVELEREVAKKPVAAPAETVEVPVLSQDDRWQMGELKGELAVVKLELERVEQVMDRIAATLEHRVTAPAPTVKLTQTVRPRAAAPVREATTGDVVLGKTERRVLSILAEHGSRTMDQIALLSGYSPKASTIPAALSKLRKARYVADGQPITATPEGINWLGPYEQLPQGQDLIDYWRHKFGKTERRVLDALLCYYPTGLTLAEICEQTGYSPSASTVPAAMSKLRKVGVVDGWGISDDFASSTGLA